AARTCSSSTDPAIPRGIEPRVGGACVGKSGGRHGANARPPPPRSLETTKTAWAVRGSLERRRAQMKNHSTQRATMLGKTASYINRHHLALVALFFALGGTSVAASNALLPGNSVGTKQVIDG